MKIDESNIKGTLYASHIEQPIKTFFVNITTQRFFNVFWQDRKTSLFKILAETEDGAMKVAKFHYGTLGESFELVKQPQVLLG